MNRSKDKSLPTKALRRTREKEIKAWKEVQRVWGKNKNLAEKDVAAYVAKTIKEVRRAK